MKDLKLPLHQKNNQLVSINDITNAQEFVIVENTGAASTNNEMPKYKIGVLICLGVIFYFLFCGIDSYFQSQTYTYGLCGPLELSSDTAGNKIKIWKYLLYFIQKHIKIYFSRMVKHYIFWTLSNWPHYFHTNIDLNSTICDYINLNFGLFTFNYHIGQLRNL